MMTVGLLILLINLRFYESLTSTDSQSSHPVTSSMSQSQQLYESTQTSSADSDTVTSSNLPTPLESPIFPFLLQSQHSGQSQESTQNSEGSAEGTSSNTTNQSLTLNPLLYSPLFPFLSQCHGSRSQIQSQGSNLKCDLYINIIFSIRYSSVPHFSDDGSISEEGNGEDDEDDNSSNMSAEIEEEEEDVPDSSLNFSVMSESDDGKLYNINI